jgi:short-subunit dehydrogenase
MDLKGRLALVTGASSGIGDATARALARAGADVVLVARSAEKLETVARSIERDGGKAFAVPADLASADDVARMSEAVRAQARVPDIVINNAGAGRFAAALETSAAEAREMIEVPYLAAFYVTRAFIPDMVARRSGHIVCVTSPGSYLAWPNACAYIAARHALKGFAEALRSEVAQRGIFVSLVVLGTVESPYWEHNPGSRDNLPKGFPAMSTDDAAAIILQAIAQRRRHIIRPRLFRLLFALAAIAPSLASRFQERAACTASLPPSS